MNTFTKLTLCLTLLTSLASCGSEKEGENQPPDPQPVTQAAQPKAQQSQPEAQDSQPQAPEAKKTAQTDEKKWLLPAMADIGLTAEQEARIKPISIESNKQMKAVREDTTLESAEKQEKLRLIGSAMFDQYKAILTPEQWTDFLEARKALAEKNKPVTPAGKES